MLDYRPDWQPSTPGLLTIARNVVPDEAGNYFTSYAAQTSGYGTTIGGTGITAARLLQTPTTPRLVVGRGTKLFDANGAGGWNDRSGTTYGLGAGQRWCFTQFGDETIACSLGAPTQKATATGSFSDLSGAPKAAIALVVSGHLLLANYNDGTAVPSGVKWASQDSTTDWTATNSNTAGDANLRESLGGPLVAGAEIHDIAVLWKRRSMYVGRKIGGAGTDIFQFNLLSPKIGCVGIEAWASTPIGIVFVSENGIYKFDGSVPEPIDEGIRKQIYITISNPSTVEVSHDEKRNCVFIWVPGGTICWGYNYRSNKWSQAYASTSNLGSTTHSSFVTHVRDSNYQDALSLLANGGLAESTHLVMVDGPRLANLASTTIANSLVATLETGLIRAPDAAPNQWTLIKRAVPLWATEQSSPVEASAGAVTVTPYSRISGSGALTNVTGTYDTTEKRFDVLAKGNTLKFSFAFTNVYMGVNDIAYEFGPSGKR